MIPSHLCLPLGICNKLKTFNIKPGFPSFCMSVGGRGGCPCCSRRSWGRPRDPGRAGPRRTKGRQLSDSIQALSYMNNVCRKVLKLKRGKQEAKYELILNKPVDLNIFLKY